MSIQRALRSHFVTSILVTGLLLFAQSGHAVQSCVTPHSAQVMAFAQDRVADCTASQHPGAPKAHCVQSDQVSRHVPLLALDMPPALPLLIVTRAEDIAEWHAEIFERLSATPPDSAPQLCELKTKRL